MVAARSIPLSLGSSRQAKGAKQVFPKVAAGFGSKNLLDEGT
jgi:hypothetical protein